MLSPRDLWEQRAAAMRSEHLSARTFDAGGALDVRRLRDLRACLDAHGAVHAVNTGLCALAKLAPALDALGFSECERFTLGGRTSADVQTHWAAPGWRRMDHYPPSLYLLPNNEVQYRRAGPARVMFFCQTPPRDGGRTFLHAAEAVEAGLRAAGPLGAGMLERIARHGLTIETGFLDRAHPRKGENYFQSWQERYGTDDPSPALARARAHADEVDLCWWRDEESGHPTLMTRITLRGFKTGADGRKYLRLPRIAMDPPSALNGYRRFPLGDGEELSEPERALLRDVYLATREGTALRAGDLVAFDNVRYGHSRESFSGEREVYVAMAGEVREDDAHSPPPAPAPRPVVHRCARADANERYVLPPASTDRAARFPSRTFDAGGALTDAVLAAARAEFDRHGALHMQNTGLACAHEGLLPDDVLAALGFAEHESFAWGGMHSGRTARRPISRALRATDDYPPDRWLLPHNEVLYQRRMPARLLFFSAREANPARGGRTFVHASERLEAWLRACGRDGDELLKSLDAHGFLIEMGFLDEGHPERHANYFRSWQDRFETRDRDEALARCRAASLQFDEAWWRDEPLPGGGVAHTLMTRIRVPARCRHPALGRDLLLFPRIALDGPRLANGHRSFPLGDGAELTDAQVDLLLGAFLATREGAHYGAGDILLVDNLRYGHSRESYEGARTLGVAMAGVVLSNDAPRGA